MVDADEEISLTLKREFNEEALNSLEGDQKEQTRKDIARVFKNGEVVSLMFLVKRIVQKVQNGQTNKGRESDKYVQTFIVFH